MAEVLDVAAYIMMRRGEMTAMRLQKLCYYAYAWHLVWDEVRLFEDRFEAWAYAPVCRPLYEVHRGSFKVSEVPGGDPSALNDNELESVDAVLRSYAGLTGQQISDLTHCEKPWLQAREGLRPGERGCSLLEDRAISDYYASLYVSES